MGRAVRVFAPATVANLGPGFDVLGLALSKPGDLVEAELTPNGGVEIVELTGDDGLLSRDSKKNVAAVAAAEVLRRAQSPRGLRMSLHKQMPLASGLGSSGASSAAGAYAANELLDRPLTPLDLVQCAMEGERAATGSPHADNVAPSLLGGIALVRSYDPLDIVQLPVPKALHVSVVHPHWHVSTADARALLAGRTYPMAPIVSNLGDIAGFVAGLYSGNLELIGRSINDALVEPLRSRLIPGFDAVREAARAAGALGCSIAGSGPSVFAFAGDKASGERIGAAMQAAFKTAAQLDSDLFTGPVSELGARRLD